MRPHLKNHRGFTLIELMIVVAIVGVLASLAIYGVRGYMAHAKTTEARNSLGEISKDAATARNTVAFSHNGLGLRGTFETTNAGRSISGSAIFARSPAR